MCSGRCFEARKVVLADKMYLERCFEARQVVLAVTECSGRRLEAQKGGFGIRKRVWGAVLRPGRLFWQLTMCLGRRFEARKVVFGG